MCAGAPRHLGKGAQMPPPFHPRLGRLIVCIEQTLSRLRETIRMVFAKRPLGLTPRRRRPHTCGAGVSEAKREEGRLRLSPSHLALAACRSVLRPFAGACGWTPSPRAKGDMPLPSWTEPMHRRARPPGHDQRAFEPFGNLTKRRLRLSPWNPIDRCLGTGADQQNSLVGSR